MFDFEENAKKGFKACQFGLNWCRFFACLFIVWMCADLLFRNYAIALFDLLLTLFFFTFANRFKKKREYWEFRLLELNFKVKED